MIDTNALRSRIAEKGFFNLYADIFLFNIINLFTVLATGLHNVKKFENRR